MRTSLRLVRVYFRSEADNFFFLNKEPESTYFRLSADRVISVTITLSLKHENSHRQDVNEWCGYVSLKSYLQNGRPYLTTDHSLLTTELDQQKAVITEMVLPHHSRLLECSSFLWGTRLRMVALEGRWSSVG